MGSMGSPFDAPLPRFQQAAAHLSMATNAKKPPLSPAPFPDSGGSIKNVDFPSCPSLERGGSLSSISRRRLTSSLRNDLTHPSNSLASVQETESEDGETLDVTSMPEVTLLLPKAISLGLPCPELLQPKQPGGKGNSASGKGNNPGGCFFTRQLPAILATGGILTLMVVSVIALWPAAPMELQRSPAARDSQPSLPRKFLDKLFTTTPKLPGIEHFTAAQASGLGSGFGLEDPDTPTDRIHPSESFAAWVSLHTGYEPELDSQQPQQVDSAKADFVKSETLDDHLPRAGAFGEGIVTVDTNGNEVKQQQQQQQQPQPGVPQKGKVPPVEGRKELETSTTTSTPSDTSSSSTAGGTYTVSTGTANGNSGGGVSTAAGVNPNGGVSTASSTQSIGVIPQETIQGSANLFAGSTGVADPANLVPDPNASKSVKNAKDTTGTTTTSTSSSAGKIAVQPNTGGGGTNTGSLASSGTSQGSESTNPNAGSLSTNSGSTVTTAAGTRIASSGTMSGGSTGISGGSASTTARVASSGTMNGGSTGISGGSSTNGASSLRRSSGSGSGSTSRGSGTASGSFTPLETVANGQTTSVAQSELSSTTQQVGSSSNMGGMFTTLGG